MSVRCLCGGQLTVIGDTGGENARSLTCRCGTCNNFVAVGLTVRILPKAGGVTGLQHAPGCGTVSGYKKHRRHNEPACADCKAAHAAAEQHRNQLRKAAAA